MKRTLKFGLAVFIMLLFVVQLSAQGPGGPGRGFQMSEDDIKAQVESTSKSLKLSDAQHQEILKYELDFYNKRQIEFQKMRNSGEPPDREAMRARMTTIMEERNAKYQEVLTPDQYKQFTEIQDQRRSEMQRQREQQQQQQNPDAAPAEERPARGRGRG
jgi:Spy/CpxP family protein refolding chaperone